MKHVTIFVSGRVQGVFYRASAREMALQLGIRGFVRNEPDGSVYLEAEGEEAALNQFVAWCRKGPVRAIVSNVQVIEGAWAGFSSFIVDKY
jgi:acylphosphatase